MSAVTRLLPTSITGRLMLGAAALVLLSLLVSGVAITLSLQRFVRVQLDQRLDLQIQAVAAALEPGPDGKLTFRGGVDAPPFDRPHGGWSWIARTGDQVFRSGSLAEDHAGFVPGEGGAPPEGAPPPPTDAATPSAHRGERPRGGPDGRLGEIPVVSRSFVASVGAQAVTITATAPREALAGPVRDAIVPVALTLVTLGALLAAGSAVQLRLGLRPLSAVRRAVEEVRHGRAARLPGDQPAELQPLVGEINALIEENAEGLRRARSHVANLGHALKTPLTSLGLTLGDSAEDQRRRILLDEMQARVRHHLGRARTAAVGAPGRVATPVRTRLDDLVAMLGKIHAGRAIRAELIVPSELAVACEPQDLDEMLGNLLDNAFKWAATRLTVTARPSGRMAEISIGDDGPGVPDARAAEALMPGRRLDETVPGDGFGLSITRELAELYGGELTLGRSASGGLVARLALPLAGGAAHPDPGT